MKKNMKVIQISGLKGLLSFLFITACLAAGFIGFPGLIAMSAWNWVSVNYLIVPEINLFQGILLWAIAALIYFITERKKVYVSFGSPNELNDSELKHLIHKIKEAEKKNVSEKTEKEKVSK